MGPWDDAHTFFLLFTSYFFRREIFKIKAPRVYVKMENSKPTFKSSFKEEQQQIDWTPLKKVKLSDFQIVTCNIVCE